MFLSLEARRFRFNEGITRRFCLTRRFLFAHTLDHVTTRWVLGVNSNSNYHPHALLRDWCLCDDHIYHLCDDCGIFKRAAAEHKKGESNDSIIVADEEFLCEISKQEGGIVWTMMEDDAKQQRYLSPESSLLK